MTLLAAQSAYETDLVGNIKKYQNNWLERHYENLIFSTLPDMRYIPWGDLQGGPNGGVTMEMAGVMDAVAWALKSPHGAHFSKWLAKKRGLARFHAETPIFYMLYTRHLETEPAEPPLSYLAGNKQGGHFIARSGWDDGATVVSFGCKDHYGDHNHYDQGGFMIYRNGLLAVDPPVYRKVAGPQQPTEVHNTLLIGGRNQRNCRGQWFTTLEIFKQNLTKGQHLETGDILFYREAGDWAAVAGQFAQAYTPDAVKSCVRQLLFLRPDKVVIVDHLVAPGKDGELPEVQWLLQLPQKPRIKENGSLTASNGASWIRCTPVWPEQSSPEITATQVNTYRASYHYKGKHKLSLVHLLVVGDGEKPGKPLVEARVQSTGKAVEVTLNGKRFVFASQHPFEVDSK